MLKLRSQLSPVRMLSGDISTSNAEDNQPITGYFNPDVFKITINDMADTVSFKSKYSFFKQENNDRN